MAASRPEAEGAGGNAGPSLFVPIRSLRSRREARAADRAHVSALGRRGGMRAEPAADGHATVIAHATATGRAGEHAAAGRGPARVPDLSLQRLQVWRHAADEVIQIRDRLR